MRERLISNIKACFVDKEGPIIDENSIQAKIHPDISNTHCWIVYGKRTSIARYAITNWEKIHGPKPKKLFICHKCDNINGGCCNPDHLFLGTNKENMIDCSLKKRSNLKGTKGPIGQKFSNKKLSENHKINLSISGKKAWKMRKLKKETNVI